MMTGFPISPKLARGGIVVLDGASGRVRRIIAFQYNADTVTRTMQVRGVGAESGDRMEALRLKGPPAETIKLEAELDATDQLEFPDLRTNDAVARSGLHPALAALEMLVYPSSDALQDMDRLAAQGAIEIAPLEAPLTLFIWGRNRIIPVRITELSVTEEAFDSSLNPTRAKVSLGLRVLSVDDVGFDHRAGALYLLHQQQKEKFLRDAPAAELTALGITAVPGG
jgi:hypothetical protein